MACQAIMEFYFMLIVGSHSFLVVSTALSVTMKALHRVKLKITQLWWLVHSLILP